MSEYIDIISLGAGVQSSTMLMMADQGMIELNGKKIIPRFAIMSDTGNEPKKVYDWLKYLQTQVKNIEIVLTDNGNIIEDTLKGIENNERFASVPFFTKKVVPVYKQILIGTEKKKVWNDEYDQEIEVEEPVYKQGERLGTKTEKGVLWRQCTGEYKINAVRKEIRKLLGYGPRDKVREKIRLWMGISTDEVYRMKPSQVKYINNYFPLIEYNMSRFDCLKWFDERDMPLPPRSSCIICPYHSNEHWRDMKKNDPDSWAMAVEFDKAIRNMPKLEAEVFLHRQCVPLDQADLGVEQLDLFDSECEGMCGL